MLGICGKWIIGDWSSCSCENLTQTRKIECSPKENTTQINNQVICDLSAKPIQSRACKCFRPQKSEWKIVSKSEVSLKKIKKFLNF